LQIRRRRPRDAYPAILGRNRAPCQTAAGAGLARRLRTDMIPPRGRRRRRASVRPPAALGCAVRLVHRGAAGPFSTAPGGPMSKHRLLLTVAAVWLLPDAA